MATVPPVVPPDCANAPATVIGPVPLIRPPLWLSAAMDSAPPAVSVPFAPTATVAPAASAPPSVESVPFELIVMELDEIVPVPLTVVTPVVTVTAPGPSSAPEMVPPWSDCAPEDVTDVPAAIVAPPDCVNVPTLMSTHRPSCRPTA